MTIEDLLFISIIVAIFIGFLLLAIVFLALISERIELDKKMYD